MEVYKYPWIDYSVSSNGIFTPSSLNLSSDTGQKPDDFKFSPFPSTECSASSIPWWPRYCLTLRKAHILAQSTRAHPHPTVRSAQSTIRPLETSRCNLDATKGTVRISMLHSTYSRHKDYTMRISSVTTTVPTTATNATNGK